MLGIAREEQSNPVELKFFRGTTGANVVADATPDADRTLRLRSTVPHFSQYPYIGLGHSCNIVHYGKCTDRGTFEHAVRCRLIRPAANKETRRRAPGVYFTPACTGYIPPVCQPALQYASG